jgi:hypothetical protein
MKIAISGTHSTGKSTFIRAIESALGGQRIGKIGDLASRAALQGFPILRDHTFSSTIWMMSMGIALEQEAALTHELVLVDRPVMEPIAYLRAALQTQKRTISPKEEQCLYNIARSYAFTYDIIVKTVVDPTIPISTSQERDHDQDFRLLAAAEIDRLYPRIGCPYIELRNGDHLAMENVIGQINTKLGKPHA